MRSAPTSSRAWSAAWRSSWRRTLRGLEEPRGLPGHPSRPDRVALEDQAARRGSLSRGLRRRDASRRREHEVTARLPAGRRPERVSARDLFLSAVAVLVALSLSAAPAANKAPRTPKQYTI